MRSRGLRPNDYDPTAFVVNDVGTFGNLGRNTGFGPDLWNTDIAILKSTRIPKISEAFTVQFRAEIFNIFNHTSLGLPNLTLFTAAAFKSPNTPVVGDGAALNPNAGRITATTTTSRQIQLALKFIF